MSRVNFKPNYQVFHSDKKQFKIATLSKMSTKNILKTSTHHRIVSTQSIQVCFIFKNNFIIFKLKFSQIIDLLC